jgi:hypothetical protein
MLSCLSCCGYGYGWVLVMVDDLWQCLDIYKGVDVSTEIGVNGMSGDLYPQEPMYRGF